MASLTIKKIEDRVLDRLREQARQRKLSLNAYIRQLLTRSAGLEPGMQAFSDLTPLAGSWTAEEEAEFLEHTRSFRQIDEDLWR